MAAGVGITAAAGDGSDIIKFWTHHLSPPAAWIFINCFDAFAVGKLLMSNSTLMRNDGFWHSMFSCLIVSIKVPNRIIYSLFESWNVSWIHKFLLNIFASLARRWWSYSSMSRSSRLCCIVAMNLHVHACRRLFSNLILLFKKQRTTKNHCGHNQAV